METISTVPEERALATPKETANTTRPTASSRATMGRSRSTSLPLALYWRTTITLGAIGTATAPAATLMVVRQYKAKGKLVDLLLPIVALDDAVGLVVFAVSFGVAKALSSGTVDMVSILVNPLVEIVCSWPWARFPAGC